MKIDFVKGIYTNREVSVRIVKITETHVYYTCPADFYKKVRCSKKRFGGLLHFNVFMGKGEQRSMMEVTDRFPTNIKAIFRSYDDDGNVTKVEYFGF